MRLPYRGLIQEWQRFLAGATPDSLGQLLGSGYILYSVHTASPDLLECDVRPRSIRPSIDRYDRVRSRSACPFLGTPRVCRPAAPIPSKIVHGASSRVSSTIRWPIATILVRKRSPVAWSSSKSRQPFKHASVCAFRWNSRGYYAIVRRTALSDCFVSRLRATVFDGILKTLRFLPLLYSFI